MKLQGKRILVTGSGGFIGSHLVEALQNESCEVRALVHYNSLNDWGWLETLSKKRLKNLEISSGDIRDPGSVRNAMKDIDVIFHLAALIGIPYSYYSPESYVDTNIKGTLNILQIARENMCQKILITSTSEVYGTAKYVPIDEKHPYQGQSPYSATKIGADRLAESFYRSFGLPIVIARPFNTFGPRQSARAVIPTIITQLLSGGIKIKLGDLNPTRDLVYVKDTVQGFIELAKSDEVIGEEINIATQSEISIGDLAKKIIDLINPEAHIILDKKRIRPKGSEVERLFGSKKKITKMTNWTNNYDLEKGLIETIDWFRVSNNIKRYKSNIYNL